MVIGEGCGVGELNLESSIFIEKVYANGQQINNFITIPHAH